ncbi:alpha/beta hydrolase [Alteromonas sp. MYP5]|uniref:Alpha/beta hydrolase n=2 Tax=Alteromonas ponticola TaxID=2720613 RepID=A0ABX1QYA7_9ALTE|nr:alpha/beta hydrolase [Alteromonas ponticola]
MLFCSLVHAQSPQVDITLPPSYETEMLKNYPVIYLLDGRANQSMLKGMLERLYLSAGSYEHIVVSIDVNDRLDEFAPTINKDPRGPVGKGGGADNFLDFIEKELIPRINENYRTIPLNTIAGHSVAGLTVIHSFHSRPHLFQSHLAFSPAVWWGARETAKSAQQYVVAENEVGTYLYMNIGSEGGEMRSVYDLFAATILENRSIDLTLRLNEFNDVGHDFTMAAGLYNALSGLYQYQRVNGIK